MSDMLQGKEVSGTPIETRKGAAQLGSYYANRIYQGPGGIAQPFLELGGQAARSILGFDASGAGIPGAVTAALQDPVARTSALMRTMQPFEERETNRQVAQLRDMFGTMGGRFSRNLGSAEAELRSGLSAEFERNRENALLAAQSQRNQALASILGSLISGNQVGFSNVMAPWAMANQYLSPGAPMYREGILPGLISAAGNIFAASQLGPAALLRPL